MSSLTAHVVHMYMYVHIHVHVHVCVYNYGINSFLIIDIHHS